MELENILWMLVALAGVVVLLTRLRLHANEAQAGHAQISDGLVNAHTVVGVVTLAVAGYYLSSPSDGLGYAAAGVWWIEAIIGLLILARWLPGGGRHAADATDDSWAQGPFLSILGHVGMVLGVAFFSYCVLAGKIG
ncbi:hypothetical protein [Aeromicrobium stalagmiti]|uniref:hypothetical protein n=1 Tax=Aeromicrobium stalagmiti TaxID=2738988 RepID=UPI0015694D09|nr:hypothetical protein [Aeromicrobium stalagmiti]NRQ50108.1 hypothetical protein [Aeromicrobium stalagmiti]